MDDTSENTYKKSEPKKGRRARSSIKNSKESIHGKVIDNSNTLEIPVKTSRRQLGWDRSSTTSVNEPLDARLIPDSPQPSSDEGHSIPDIDTLHEDDLTQEVAAPPSAFTSNIASYRELDRDLVNRSAFRTLDGDIDLKALVKNLSSDQEVQLEPDVEWEWESLFADVSSHFKPKEEVVMASNSFLERAV